MTSGGRLGHADEDAKGRDAAESRGPLVIVGIISSNRSSGLLQERGTKGEALSLIYLVYNPRQAPYRPC